MTVDRRIDIRIPSRYQDLDFVRRILAAVRDDIRLPPDAILRVEICVVEAVGNAIRHAYGLREDGVVDIALTLAPDRLVIDVSDRGQAMSLENRRHLKGGAPPPSPDGLAVRDLPEGGMGFPILRSVLDDLEYTSDGGRNTLRMHKLFAPAPAPSA